MVTLETSWSLGVIVYSAEQTFPIECYYCVMGELGESAMRHTGTLFPHIVSLAMAQRIGLNSQM